MNINSHLQFNRLRRGSVLNLVLIGLMGVILLGIGTWLYFSGSGVSELDEPLTAEVFSGLFVKEVLDQGEIQSSENVEVRSKVKSRYGSRGVTVKRVVEEGTMVGPGDFLIELRSDEIQENLDNQNIEVNNAQDSLTAAENNLASAEAALKEYLEGVYEEALISVENEISEATEALNEAEEYYKFSLKLQAKNFIQPSELRSDESKVNRAKRTLQLALKKREVLKTHTLVKNRTELQSAIDIAQSKKKAAQTNLDIENATLKEIQDQFDACTIVCPEDASGQVVYANIFSRRGNSEFVLEEGASVREGQVLIRIPNPDRMQVRATVNESRVTSISEEMKVNISVDALNGRELEGEVRKVNQYAEPEGWGGGGVRKYAVYIDILDPIPEIRPGMNSSVLIETERVENALMVPIQAVYGYRGKTFCMVKRNESWKTVEVEVGSNNDTNVVILSGLERGEEVAMNPSGHKELLNLPDIPEVEEKSDRGGKSKSRSKNKSQGKSDKKSGKQKPAEKKPVQQKPESKKATKQKQDKPETKKYPGSKQKKSDSRDSGPNTETVTKPSANTDSKA